MITDKKPRPTKTELHMRTAFLWARRATCKQPNRKIGCVITNNDMNCILAISYNGPPKAMSNDACRNISGDCGCVHAEENAIARVDNTTEDKILFITMEPCERCANLIAQAKIWKVYYNADYRHHKGIERLRDCGIIVEQLLLPDIQVDMKRLKND